MAWVFWPRERAPWLVKRSTIFQAAHVLVGLHELLHERLDDGLFPFSMMAL